MPLPLLLALGLLVPCVAPRAADGEEAALTSHIAARGDDADPAGFFELASFATPEALSGLVELLERMESLYMRREVLRALALLVDVESTHAGAIQTLAHAAGSEPSLLLRETAVAALAALPAGRAALAELVSDETLRREVRLEALEGFVRRVTEKDEAFLERIHGSSGARAFAPELRVTAFRAAVPWLSSARLHKATRARLSGVRLAALEGLRARGDRRLASAAERVYDLRSASDEERLHGALVWIEAKGARAARALLEDALAASTPEVLAVGLAEAVAELGDPGLERIVRQRLRKADGRELRVLLRAARPIDDPAVDDAFEEALASEDPRVVREAVNGLAARSRPRSVAPLRELVANDEDGWLAGGAVAALAGLPEGIGDDELAVLSGDLRSAVRHAALQALADRGGAVAEAAVLEGLEHADWSTRLAAVEGVVALRTRAGVGALCRRLGAEEGRLEHDIADALWELTGEPYGTNARAWKRWWEDVGDTFVVISREELARREAEREERRLRRTSRATFVGRDGSARFVADLDPEAGGFFGLQVVSHRVVFAIDVSISMDERLDGVLDDGGIRTRLHLAQRELSRMLEQLDPRTRFRLITFSGVVDTWADELRPASAENVAAARAFVQGLSGGPATNIYDTLRLAFADANIDTIYLLSDGEPTAGDIRDTGRLRAIVREWNRFRGIEVHCIAIGGDLGLLRGLSRDSGGSYAYFH